MRSPEVRPESRNVHRLAMLFLFALPVLGAPIAWADLAPPVGISMPADSPQAVSGEVYEGIFEIDLAHQGLLQKFEIVGEGWEILEADLPTEGFFTEPTAFKIRFRARPENADEPIGLRVAYECQTLTRTFAIGPDAFAKRGRPASELQRVPGSGIKPGSGTTEEELRRESSQRGAGNIRFVGRVVYDRGDILPLANIGVDTIRIRVLDVDDFGNELIWTGFTDTDGYFDTGDVYWNDCDTFGCDDPDLLLSIIANTGVVDVTNSTITEDTYYFIVPEITDFTGDFYDYGVIKPSDPTRMPVLHMFNTIVRTHRLIESLTGLDTPKVQIEWPDPDLGNAGAHYEAVWNPPEIHVGAAKQWNEATLAHEYGHHFIKEFSVFIQPDYCNGYCDGTTPCTSGMLCEDSGHCAGCPENDHDAWNEGWPNWLADLVTRHLGAAYDPPGYTRDGESVADCCQDGTLHEFDALEVEGFVAALLRDIDDLQSDVHSWNPDLDGVIRDITCLGADEIFDVVVTANPVTVEGFLNGFIQLYPDEVARLRLTATNVSPLYASAPNFPVDTQVMGPVTFAHSISHPTGQDTYLPCMTMAWGMPQDDVLGACDYSYDWSSSPSVTVDEFGDPVGASLCQYTATQGFNTPGSKYFGIRAAECGFPMQATTSVFGPFEIGDCNNSGVLDLCDISCGHAGYDGCSLAPSFCNVAGCGTSTDCNNNLAPDECDIADGSSNDCNKNNVPDECELMKNWAGGSGPWATPSGWIENAIPGNGDHVCIQDAAAASTVTYTTGDTTIPILASDESLSVGGASGSRTLTLLEPSWILGDLWLGSPSSNVQVDNRLDIGGLFVWTGNSNSTNAKLRGAGTTYVSGGLNIPSGVVGLQDHDLVLEPGSTSLVLGRIDATGAASLTIRPTATLDYQGTSHLVSGAQLNVEGTLTKSVFTGTSNIAAPMQNDGLVHVQDGGLAFLAGSQTSGDILGDPSTTIEFGCGGHELTTSSSLIADRVSFTGGNCGARTVRGSYDVTTQTANTSTSNVTFTSEANIVGYGTTLLLTNGNTTFDAVAGQTLVFDSITSSGATYFNSGDPIVTTDLIFGGGRVYGPSEITVSGSFTWSNGASMYGPGITNSNGTLTVTSGTAQKRLYDRVLNISGSAIFEGGIGLFTFGAEVNILSSGVMDLRFDGAALANAGPYFSNAGILVKSVGTGTSRIDSTTTNTGLIEVQTGTLEFRYFTQNSGQILLNGGDFAMYQISTPQPLVLAGGSLTGSGTITGVVNNTGGSLEPGQSAGTLTMTHNYNQSAGGRFVAELGGLAPGTEHDQLILTGAATATLAGTLRVELINGFVPAVGDTFDVVVAPNVTGIFDTIETAGFPAGLDVRIIDNTNGIRLQVFDPNCDGVVASLGLCPGAICPVIDYTIGGEPLLTFDDPASCPVGGLLPGNVDFVQGRASALTVAAGAIPLGIVAPTHCDDNLAAFLWGGPPAQPGTVEFLLARAQGAGNYGLAAGGEARTAGQGDCP